MAAPRWILLQEGPEEAIVDAVNGMNFAFLATSGMETTSDSIKLAERIVEFLNSLPPEETILYPFTLETPERGIMFLDGL